MGAAAPSAYPISCFDKRGHARIRFCMTKILTVRLPAGLHDKAEARAMRLGLDRAKYVRSLIEDDLSGARDKTQRVFASEDLVGLYQGDTGPATNASARERLRARAATQR
jgi:predicted DNA-binding protein